MSIEIVERRCRDFNVPERGSQATTRNKSILRASSGTNTTRPCGVAMDSPVIQADGTSSVPGAKSSETRIGSCESERNSARVPCATRTSLIHDHDAVGAVLQFGERVRGKQHGGAVVAATRAGFRRTSGAAQDRGRWSARRAAARAGVPSKGLRQTETLAHALGISADAPMRRPPSSRRARAASHCRRPADRFSRA